MALGVQVSNEISHTVGCGFQWVWVTTRYMLRVTGYGLWVTGYGFWVMGYRVQGMGYGLPGIHL